MTVLGRKGVQEFGWLLSDTLKTFLVGVTLRMMCVLKIVSLATLRILAPLGRVLGTCPLV
jgi:hypothetical protein